MDIEAFLACARLPGEVVNFLHKAPSVTVARNIDDLGSLACGSKDDLRATVSYDIPDGRRIDEVDVVRVRNGICANYREAYMRRRDPECMVVADRNPSDKPHFSERYDFDFDDLKSETFAWFGKQNLAIFGFATGQSGLGTDALAICPANAGFFAFGLGLLQGVVDPTVLNREFRPATIIYVAPPFRHTHFGGKQVVVHDRGEVHEIFSYNLYPGPSAKKGVYGALIELGEQQGWVTAHCSAVQVITPYDNLMTIMHEGASGGGKSEMLEQPYREPDGRLLIGVNTVTGERFYLEVPRSCELRPVCDDMAMCHPSQQKGAGKLAVCDAEDGWFVRVNHIEHYGTDPHLEKLTAEPTMPLLFLNIDAVPGSRALIWEHTQDAPGVPCPNPRVVIPRTAFSNVVQEPVTVDVRSFGMRTPPCTKEHPTYGILGMFHVLPPALAWLWRLVAPRGHANPSIVDTGGMSSEGVGSYWPFTTGKKVAQANLLLRQFVEHKRMRYILCPNQYVGAWRVGFMPQWIVRDYLARRGVANFRPNQLHPSRCQLLGYTPRQLQLEGHWVNPNLLRVEMQPEVGEAAYDQGAEILYGFFRNHLSEFASQDIEPLGKDIIACCLDCGKVEDYEKLIPTAK